jgi:hypothetical protein
MNSEAVDLALDLVLMNFPRDAMLLRFRDHASWTDPDLRYLFATTFPRVFGCYIEYGNIDIVDSLLMAGVDPSRANNAAIGAAAEKGLVAVVERLLADPRVDPSAVDNRAIRNASWNGHATIVERLLADPRVGRR